MRKSVSRIFDRFLLPAAGLALVLGVAYVGAPLLRTTTAFAGEVAVKVPPAALDATRGATGLQTAVFSGGCFWGMQGVFEHVKGVTKVLAGYTGGAGVTARYDIVSTGQTGHAESVQVIYDPSKVSYATLLRVFFSSHDPTQVDRQGPDDGSQYRSEVWYANDRQKATAQAYIAQLEKAGLFHDRIATRVDPLHGFYKAEAYHQDYLIRNPDSVYIVINDLPKIENLKTMYPALYRADPVRVAAAD